MSGDSQVLPPGWHVDEDTGAWVRDVIHRMGRLDYAEGRGPVHELVGLSCRGEHGRRVRCVLQQFGDKDFITLKPADFRIVESLRLDADEKLNIE